MGYFDQEDDIHIPDSNDVNVSSFGSWSTCDCESFYCTFLIVVFGFFHSFRQWNFSVPPHFRSFTYTRQDRMDQLFFVCMEVVIAGTLDFT